LFNVESQASPAATKPLVVEMIINGQTLPMEVDTGSAVTLVSEHTFKSKWPNTSLQSSSVKLKTYSNEQLRVVSQFEAKIKYSDQSARLPLIVVEGNGPSLFGRDWLLQFRLNWKQIHSVQKCDLTEVLNRHTHVFNEGLGTLQGYEAQLYVDPQILQGSTSTTFYANSSGTRTKPFSECRNSGTSSICRVGIAYCSSTESGWSFR